jgi:ATP adenylyltransferase
MSNSVRGNTIGDVYAPPTILEHGPSRDGQGMGCGVDHVHVHVIPLSFSLTHIIQESPDFQGLRWSRALRGLSDLSKLHQQGRSYVFVKEPDSQGVYCTPISLPCQSVRRAMAHKMGMGQRYDYNEHPFTANVERTVDRLAGCL